MQCQQIIRAGLAARAQRPTIGQRLLPTLLLGRPIGALAQVGELNKLHAFVSTQNNQSLAQGTAIEVHPHSQRHIEEISLEISRQPFGLAQHTQRCVVGAGTQCQGAQAQQP
ncbi:hypothetical protein D9M71_262390 [compost metagenome]